MGSPKKPKVGNRYFYGVHLIPCRKADAVLAVKMADKVLWEGEQGQGYIDIDARDAFGGDEREGGFSGRIAVMLGGALQTANAYLQGIFGTLTPAFRGVVSLVFERPYFNANSARLPKVEVKMLNVADIHKGWEPDTCVVEFEGVVPTAAIYIAMDVSLSMAGAPLATQGAALAGFVRAMVGKSNSIKVVAYSATINASIERLDCTDDDLEDVATWIEDYTSLITGGDWNEAVSEAAAFFAADDAVDRTISSGTFFDDPGSSSALSGLVGGGSVATRKRRIIVFTTDGAPVAGTPELAAATIAAIGGVEVFAFNIDDTDTTETAKIDNTPRDGVPVVPSSDPNRLRLALAGAFRTWADLNPAHIQRCLLIDPMRGGTATAADIGTSFAEAADAYLAEGFGLSVIFSGADANMTDRMEIDRHCDAVTYRSRKTGKWEHRRIRDDFDFDDLPVLDGKVVKDWTKLRRPKARELPNKLTVIYTDRASGQTASVTHSNPVAVRAAGRVNKGPDARYPFVTIPSLADRICIRDLTAGATPLLGGELPLSYLPADLELSSVVRLHAPDEGINNVAVRITEIRHAGGTDASAWLKVVEHRFELGTQINMPTGPVVPVIDDRAKPATLRLVQEAPYYVLVLDAGEDAVDDQLATEPGLGRLMVAAAAPNPRHIEATVGVNTGGGWTDQGTLTFSPSSTTTEDLSSEGDDITVRIAATPSLSSVVAGQMAVIGTEILRVDAMVEDAGEILMTIGRGCLDTVPQAHASGSAVLFIGQGQPIEADYVDGEAVDVRLLTRTATSLLSLAAAPNDAVTFDSRAIRPYPPGRFKLNGSYAQDQFTTDAVFIWAHRDRTLQTTPVPEDHDDTSIGPEAGTTYRFRAEALNGVGTVLSTVTDVNVGSVTTYDWDDATVLPSGTVRLRFSIASVRDGYESWQRPSITTVRLLPPGSLTFEVL
jgi:Putative phage tail protein